MTQNRHEKVELLDENNNKIAFEHIITLDIKENKYVVLHPLTKMDGVEDDEIIILRIDRDNSGQDIYVAIDDEAKLELAYEKYVETALTEDPED